MRQKKEQIAILQTLVVAQARGREGRVEVAAFEPNIRSNIDIAKSLVFDGNVSKVSGFLTACRLYIRIKIRDTAVKKQIQ